MIDVCLLGTGGMMPLPGRHLTALMLRHNGKSLLIDCGEGSQVAIRKYAWSMYSIDHILFTHIHGDHVAGISGLLSSMHTEGRREAVHIYGPRTIEEVVANLCIVVGVSFDVYFHVVDTESFFANDLKVTPIKLNHSIECFGYRIDLARRPKFLPEKARELEIPVKEWSKLQAGESIRLGLKKISPDRVTGPERKGISLVYATDTRPCKSLESAARGVDLLVTEAIYADREKTKGALEKGHMTAWQAAEIAKNAGVRECWLTHYSPSFRDQRNYKKEMKDKYPFVSFSEDGRKTALDFEED